MHSSLTGAHFSCFIKEETKHGLNEVYDCDLSFDPACTDILGVWLLGMEGECLHENSGFRVGTRGYKRGGIQVMALKILSALLFFDFQCRSQKVLFSNEEKLVYKMQMYVL